MARRDLLAALLTAAAAWGCLAAARSGPAGDAGVPVTPVWGAPYGGVAISVRPQAPRAVLGQEFDFDVLIKNVSDAPMLLISSNPYRQYRMVLYDEDGRPVSRSEAVLDEERRAALPSNGAVFGYVKTQLAPGAEFKQLQFLTSWFAVDKPGTYSLVVMRQVGPWDQGFAVSNLAKFTLTAPGDATTPNTGDAANPPAGGDAKPADKAP